MTVSEIVGIIASIFTAISGISAAIACILTYRTTRPKIKLKPNPQLSHRLYTFGKGKSFALMDFDLINTSMIAGMVTDLSIVYEGKEYFSEVVSTNYNPYPFGVKSFFGNDIEQDIQKLRIKTPISVPGYSIISGFVFFPTFPVVQANFIVVNIKFRLADKKFKRTIRKVKFCLVTPEPVK